MDFERDYRTPGLPIAFSGINQLSPTVEDPADQLSGIDSYTRHRFVARPRRYNPVYVYGIRELLQVDLADVRRLSKYNQNVNHLLICIDTFSRKIWVKPLRSKLAVEVSRSMRSILDSMNDPAAKALFSDAGTEFTGRSFQQLLREFNIEHRLSTSDSKCPHVERVIGTLKNMVYRYLTEYETNTYINVLDELVNTYNTRIHTAHKMTPNEADDPTNRNAVLTELTKRYDSALLNKGKRPLLTIGDTVRLAIKKSTFERGFHPTFTGEVFKIKRIFTNLPEVQYEVCSYDGVEDIKGRFYRSQLQPVTSDIFKLNKVLRRKIIKGIPYAYVSWMHFPTRYNQWIPAADIVDLPQP